MRAMMKSLALLIAGGVVLALSAVPVRAMPVPPVWTYFATSCSGCLPATQFPVALGTFSSPGSSGTYSFSQNEFGPPPVVTGDDDFFFVLFGIPLPSITNACPDSPTDCIWTATWGQSATGLSIAVMFEGEFTDFRVDDTLASVSSDGDIFPCNGPPTGCYFTGYWTTSSVPLVGPSSLVGLASAILGFFLMMLVRSSGKSRPVGPDLVGAGALSAGKSG